MIILPGTALPSGTWRYIPERILGNAPQVTIVTSRVDDDITVNVIMSSW